MSDYAAQYGHLATANDTFSLGNSTAGAYLYAVNVNTKAASAVVTVYNGTSTSDPVVAVIDAATAAIDHDFHCLRLPKGCFVKLTAGNADVTVIAA